MSSITLDGVSKVYGGETVAADDVSLAIEDGEFLVIVGPSGSGKTTTLRMIAGLEAPTSGDIYIESERVTDRSARTRDVAMVFQNFALYPHMTVEQNLGFGLKLSTTLDEREIEERVREVASLLEIDPHLDDEPKELSGGQQQRVALGRAIVRYPQAFLFDEPLSNLDAKLRSQMRTEIKKLQRELGVTSVYVTHNQEEALTLADRVAVMYGGEIQQIGSPDAIYDHPTNRFVAEFIGEPSMNFVDVAVESDRDGYRLRSEHPDAAFEYNLPPDVANQVDSEVGDTATLGIRPEDIDFGGVFDDRADVMTVEVDVFEPRGSDNYHYFTVAGNDWTARTSSAEGFEAGEEVDYSFDAEDVYLFDEGGRTIKSKGVRSPLPRSR